MKSGATPGADTGAKMSLTVRGIKRLVERGRYFDGDGLYLQVRGPKNRSWVFRYQKDGCERLMGLGSLKNVDLEQARKRAIRARQQIADGVDPIQDRDAERLRSKAADQARKARSVTFKRCAQDYYDHHHDKWRNRKHAAQFLSTLQTYAYPILGDMIVGDIARAHVLEVLQKADFWKTKPETADRVRARIEAVLDFASARDLRDGANPAKWKGNLAQILAHPDKIKEKKHHAYLPYPELPAFMADLRKREGIAARALEYLILTAARTGEVTSALWDEINLDEGVWTIPKEKMKAKRDHRVPLTDEAIALLRALPTEVGNPFIFVGLRTQSLSNMAMDAVMRRMGLKDRATVHGFRATFKTWTWERTSFSRDLAEAALAHILGDKAEQAYLRGDALARRREMMVAWARFCSEPFNVSNVHRLRGVPHEGEAA